MKLEPWTSCVFKPQPVDLRQRLYRLNKWNRHQNRSFFKLSIYSSEGPAHWGVFHHLWCDCTANAVLRWRPIRPLIFWNTIFFRMDIFKHLLPALQLLAPAYSQVGLKFSFDQVIVLVVLIIQVYFDPFTIFSTSQQPDSSLLQEGFHTGGICIWVLVTINTVKRQKQRKIRQALQVRKIHGLYIPGVTDL